MLMVEPARRLARKQKIFADKSFHFEIPPLSSSSADVIGNMVKIAFMRLLYMVFPADSRDIVLEMW